MTDFNSSYISPSLQPILIGASGCSLLIALLMLDPSDMGSYSVSLICFIVAIVLALTFMMRKANLCTRRDVLSSAAWIKDDKSCAAGQCENKEFKSDNHAGEDDKDAASIAFEDMKALGMNPERDEDGDVMFRFEGGFFRMTSLDHNIIRILYPRIFSVEIESQNLLARMLNRVNSSFVMVKLTSMPEREEGCVTVYAFADFFYRGSLPCRRRYLRQILELFFDAQHALALGMTAAVASESIDEEVLKQSAANVSLN